MTTNLRLKNIQFKGKIEVDIINTGIGKSNQEYQDSKIPFHLIDKEDQIIRKDGSTTLIQPDRDARRKIIGPVNFFNYYYTPKVVSQKIIAKIARIFFSFGWKIKIVGIDNVPNDQPCVIMPNHVSHLDAPMVGAFACKKLQKHAIHGIGDEKLWYNRFFRKFAEMINGFPVRKQTKSIEIVDYAIKRVKNGSSMFWFPEGQRHKNPEENKCYPGKIGSGMLAHAVDAPIIPSFLYGTEFAMPVGKPLSFGRRPRSINILVKYGPPVPLDDLRELPPSKDTSIKVVNRIMDHIEALRPNGKYIIQKVK